MKKDIVSLIDFYLQDCYINKTLEDVLRLSKNSTPLRITLESDIKAPEHIKVSFQESLSNTSPMSYTVPTLELKNALIDIWQKVETQANNEFIQNHGSIMFNSIKASVLKALKGEKEDEQFIFSLDNQGYRTCLCLEDKNTGMVSTVQFPEKINAPHLYGRFTCTTVVPYRGPEKGVKYTTATIELYLPTVCLPEYPLVGYDESFSLTQEQFIDKVIKSVESETSQKLLQAFDLYTTLPNNQAIGKKQKI